MEGLSVEILSKDKTIPVETNKMIDAFTVSLKITPKFVDSWLICFLDNSRIKEPPSQTEADMACINLAINKIISNDFILLV